MYEYTEERLNQVNLVSTLLHSYLFCFQHRIPVSVIHKGFSLAIITTLSGSRKKGSGWCWDKVNSKKRQMDVFLCTWSGYISSWGVAQRCKVCLAKMRFWIWSLGRGSESPHSKETRVTLTQHFLGVSARRWAPPHSRPEHICRNRLLTPAKAATVLKTRRFHLRMSWVGKNKSMWRKQIF